MSAELQPLQQVPELTEARVLVVDDEPSNVRLLERILAGVGMLNVRSTTDSRDVMALVGEFDPDVLLLDLRMPHLDGFAIMAQLRTVLAVDDFLPVVVLTADVSSQTKERALAQGATDYLTKPFDRAEVLLRIQNLLHRRLLHVQLRDHSRAMAEQLRQQAEQLWQLGEQTRLRRVRIENAITAGGPRMVFQPIFDLLHGQLLGVEALARFDGADMWGPDRWFAEATEHGLGVELELLAVGSAVGVLSAVPASGYLAVNLSAATLMSGQVPEVLNGAASRVVVEVTEHNEVTDYVPLNAAIAELRAIGVRIAVDDAGSGYASLRHVLQLAPDIIKLDCELTRDIDSDPARRALASALVAFGHETQATVVAEGIETAASLQTLQGLHVGCGQGYHLARPVEVGELAAHAGGTSLVGNDG